MDYKVEQTNMIATPLLVVRRRATLSELSKVVPDACGVVWNAIGKAQITSHGRNVCVYLNDQMDLEVGVEVGADATSEGEVVVSATPAGIVATTTHLGSYAGLYGAHVAIRQWCAANAHSLAGPNWEVYGHWSDDPEKLRTDVFYLLSGETKATG